MQTCLKKNWYVHSFGWTFLQSFECIAFLNSYILRIHPVSEVPTFLSFPVVSLLFDWVSKPDKYFLAARGTIFLFRAFSNACQLFLMQERNSLWFFCSMFLEHVMLMQPCCLLCLMIKHAFLFFKKINLWWKTTTNYYSKYNFCTIRCKIRSYFTVRKWEL